MGKNLGRLGEGEGIAQIQLTFAGTQASLRGGCAQAPTMLCRQWQVAFCRQHLGDQQTLIEAAPAQASDMQGDRHQHGTLERRLPAALQALREQNRQAASESEVRVKLEACNQFAHGKLVAKTGEAAIEPRR